jgi:hypothetical protein
MLLTQSGLIATLVKLLWWTPLLKKTVLKLFLIMS